MNSGNMNRSVVYHICLPDEWEAAGGRGSYAADSLASEGFIHCSTLRQLERSLNRFFAGAERVVVLQIEVDRLLSELRWEGADGDVFPHLYGRLNTDAVMSAQTLTANPSGTFSLPYTFGR